MHIMVPHSQAVILCEISDERARQDAKHGDPFKKSFDRLVAVIAEEFGEVATAVNDLDSGSGGRMKLLENLRSELIQTAACCVQMIEVMDKR